MPQTWGEAVPGPPETGQRLQPDRLTQPAVPQWWVMAGKSPPSPAIDGNVSDYIRCAQCTNRRPLLQAAGRLRGYSRRSSITRRRAPAGSVTARTRSRGAPPAIVAPVGL